MDNGLVLSEFIREIGRSQVLILVVVDNGLVLDGYIGVGENKKSLNPYCSGQWSRTCHFKDAVCIEIPVLILIVVDNGLVPTRLDE